MNKLLTRKRFVMVNDPNQMPPHDPNLMPPNGQYMASMPMEGMSPATLPAVMNTPPPANTKKSKKGKKAQKQQAQQMAAEQAALEKQMSPEMVAAMQMEEAIKESQNPSLRLKKLRSPFTLRSCLLNILFFVILTLVVVFLVIAFIPSAGVDRFNFNVVFMDMWRSFGLNEFFGAIGNWFTNLFSGCGSNGDDYTYYASLLLR